MKHKQVLDHLASRSLVTAMDEDLARWTGEQMLPPGRAHADIQAGVIPPILARWRCLLDAPDTPPATKGVTRGGPGMTYLPDPARQVVSIASGHPCPPVGEEPRVGEGLWTLRPCSGSRST